MAHFAKIVDGHVTQVVSVSNCAIGGCIGPDHYDYVAEQHESCGTLDFPDTEPPGQAMLAESGFDGEWIQCSYNGSFRGVYPSAGMSWDGERFAFPDPPTTVSD